MFLLVFTCMLCNQLSCIGGQHKCQSIFAAAGSLPPPPKHTGYLPLGSCRTFEGILLSPHALPPPDGKLHSRPFTRKRKAENPSSGGHVLLNQGKDVRQPTLMTRLGAYMFTLYGKTVCTDTAAA